MSKAHLIALSGICSAFATLCLVGVGSGVMNFAVLVCAVGCSLAVVIPMLVDGQNIGYSLLTYLVSSALGVFFGLENLLFVIPVVAFCMPMAIVKVRAESIKVTATLGDEQTLEDPFGQGNDRKVQQFNVSTSRGLPKVVQWLLYYVLLELSLCLTGLCVWLFTPSVWQTLVANKYLWLVVVALQIFVVIYDLLLRGCIIATEKIINKVIK